MIHAIVCIADNGVIGVDGKLPWHIPSDLQMFKSKTIGKTVVMGRKTYRSIGRALPKRKNVVLTRGEFSADDCEVVTDISEILSSADDVFVIGGVEVYNLLLDDIDKWHVTHVQGDYTGDAVLPLDLSGFFKVEESEVMEENGHSFTFATYQKLTPNSMV